MIDYREDDIRALPVFLLLDTSGSMNGALDGSKKIDKLNEAVKVMLNAFDELEKKERFVRVTILSFNDDVEIKGQMHSAPAELLANFTPLTAGGLTRLGLVLDKTKTILENSTPNSWYKSAIILVSDGKPEGEDRDFWTNELEKFIGSGKTSKAQRFSLAIGAGALQAKDVLTKFAGDEKRVLVAQKAAEIVEWFKFLSVTIVDRTTQANPDIFGDLSEFESVFENMEKPGIFSSRSTTTSRKTRKTIVAPSAQNNGDWDD